MLKFSGKVTTCCERTRPMSATWRTGGGCIVSLKTPLIGPEQGALTLLIRRHEMAEAAGVEHRWAAGRDPTQMFLGAH